VTDDALPVDRAGPPKWRMRSDWPRRLINELLALLLALLILFAAALVLLDTAPGHRFIVDRLARFETASGLNIRVGRIEGSIFSKSKLKNVTVADGGGVFLTSPEIQLDWAPGAVAWAMVFSVVTPVFSSNRLALAAARSTPASATFTSWLTTCCAPLVVRIRPLV